MLHVGGLGGGKDHDGHSAVDVAHETVVGVCVEGHDGPSRTDPRVDALRFALPEGMILCTILCTACDCLHRCKRWYRLTGEIKK